MKKFNLILFILYFLLISGIVYSKLSEKTDVFIDGYDWEQVTLGFKGGYVRGFHGGVLTGANVLLRTFNKAGRLHKFMTNEELTEAMNLVGADIGLSGIEIRQVIEGIDEIYKEYSNKKIFVFLLIPYINKKIRGVINTEDMEKKLQELRKVRQKR